MAGFKYIGFHSSGFDIATENPSSGMSGSEGGYHPPAPTSITMDNTIIKLDNTIIKLDHT